MNLDNLDKKLIKEFNRYLKKEGVIYPSGLRRVGLLCLFFNLNKPVTQDELAEWYENNHKKYEKEYRKYISELPLEDCQYCETTGQRQWDDGPEDCNACSGRGQRESFAASYPFDAENVENFRIFLEQSGGIEIC